MFLRDGDLLAAPFDPEAMEVTGTIARVVEGIHSTPMRPSGSFTFSDTGRLVYLQGAEIFIPESKLTWVNRQGETEAIQLPAGLYEDPDLSPDGQSLALTSWQDDGRSDIWVYDLARGTFGPRTSSGNARTPKWTSDGFQLIYVQVTAFRSGELWITNADGTGQPERILAGPANFLEFSKYDGKIIYSARPDGTYSINTLGLSDGSWISAPLDLPRLSWGQRVSPDGRWIAFTMTAPNRNEVYVSPYPDTESNRWPISTQGGQYPQWGPDSDELFYLQNDGSLMSVNIDTDNSFSPGIPQQLLTDFHMTFPNNSNYVVSDDGQRFIRFEIPDEQQLTELDTEPATLTVVENWFEELKRLAPPDPQ